MTRRGAGLYFVYFGGCSPREEAPAPLVMWAWQWSRALVAAQCWAGDRSCADSTQLCSRVEGSPERAGSQIKVKDVGVCDSGGVQAAVYERVALCKQVHSGRRAVIKSAV